MKKMMKKVVAYAMTFAMVATTAVTTLATKEAKADTYSCKLNFKLPAGDAASDYGVNSWGTDVTSSGATGDVTVTAWGDQVFPALTDEGNGFGSITLSGTIAGVQFVKADGTGFTDNTWNTQIQAQGLTEAFFNSADSKWYKESTFATEIKAPVLDDIYYVVGADGMIGEGWGWTTDNGLMKETTAGVHSVTFSRVADGSYEFKIVQDPKDFGWNYETVDEALKLANGNMGVTADKGVNDITVSIEIATKKVTVDVKKSPLNGADVVTMIEGLPTVDEVALTDEAAVAAVEAAYAGLSDAEKANVTNADTLTALREKLDELQKAADDAANVIVHFENSFDWSAVNAYAFYMVDEVSTTLLGEWPGKAIAANANNDGWYSFKLSCASDFTVIFNGGGEQTVDTNVAVAADGVTEVWVTMSGDKGEPDAFGNSNYLTDVATAAPAGWVDGEIEEIETEDEEDEDTEDEDTEDEDVEDEETEDEEEDQATAWDDAALKIHVKMPEGIDGWDALGIYLFGTGETFGWSGGSGEVSGAWPGTEMVLENGSDTWYAFGGTFTDGYYMAIINNFVSDDEAAEGAVKLQAADLELTDGEYWITIAADADGKYVAEVSEEAPEDYDGEGLSDDQVMEDTEEDEEDDTDGSTESDKDEDPAGGSTNGLPIACAMVLVMLTGTAVVVSRKRNAA